MEIQRKIVSMSQQIKHVYGTTRNSSEVLTKWRLRLNFNTTSTIQNSCRYVMDTLGYTKVNNKTEQINLGIKIF